MTDRITTAFSKRSLAARGHKSAFVSYVCAGDPDFDTSLAIVDRLVRAGVDVLEIGVPFSDPLADGPTNQRAAERSLASGMSAAKVFEFVRRIRSTESNVPIVFYTYYNLVFSKGVEAYVREAKAAGVDGMLVLDLPPEEAGEYLEICQEVGMKTVFIVAPTTPDSRIPLITAATTGFVYYVSREGVTGERADLAEGVSGAVSKIRAATELPVVVGFGISSADQVRATAALADGVVVGSAIVQRGSLLAKQPEPDLDGFEKFVREMVGGCS